MLQNAASDQGLHCLPVIEQFLDSSSEMDFFKHKGQYGKE